MKKHTIIKQTHQQSVTTLTCGQKGCKFFGKRAEQGVCHDNEGDLVEWARLDAHEKELAAELKALKKREGKDYIGALEAHYVTAMMNWQIVLDECIRLRRDIALLKVKRSR